jgi:hypothetical protein
MDKAVRPSEARPFTQAPAASSFCMMTRRSRPLARIPAAAISTVEPSCAFASAPCARRRVTAST